MKENLIVAIIVTSILVIQNFIALVVFSYEEGRDYIIIGSTGRRLNKLEKLVDGFRKYKNI